MLHLHVRQAGLSGGNCITIYKHDCSCLPAIRGVASEEGAVAQETVDIATTRPCCIHRPLPRTSNLTHQICQITSAQTARFCQGGSRRSESRRRCLLCCDMHDPCSHTQSFNFAAGRPLEERVGVICFRQPSSDLQSDIEVLQRTDMTSSCLSSCLSYEQDGTKHHRLATIVEAQRTTVWRKIACVRDLEAADAGYVHMPIVI